MFSNSASRVKNLVKRFLALRKSNVAARMRHDWDERARENARHYVATDKTDWNDSDFFKSGEMSFEHFVQPDLSLICQGRDPSVIRMLEIGCGVGRMTRRFCDVMGSVEAVDISPEMVNRARNALRDCKNVSFHVNNGMDLRMFGQAEFDFVFSCVVFQHIPSKAIVRSYVKEVSRVIRIGGIFKFQVQGVYIPDAHANTWVGVGFSPEEMKQMAEEFGFKIHATTGAGTQYYWLTFVKK